MNNHNNHNNPISKQTTSQNTLLSLGDRVAQRWELMQENSRGNKDRLGLMATGFIQLAEAHFREQHSPLFYAARMNITKSYLRKICKKIIGAPPIQCIQTRLMVEACALLKSPNLTVKEVAFGLGFIYTSHFSRFFKAHSGTPPNAYRKLLLKSP